MTEFLYRHRRRKTEISPDEIFLDARNLPGFEQARLEGRLERPISRSAVFGIGALFLLFGIVLFGRVFLLQVMRGAAYLRRAEHNQLQVHTVVPPRGEITDRNGQRLAWNNPAWRVTLPTDVLRQDRLAERITAFAGRVTPAPVQEMIVSDLDARLLRSRGRGEPFVVATLSDWADVRQFQSGELPFAIEPTFSRVYAQGNGFNHVVGYLGREEESTPASRSRGRAGVERAYETVLAGEKGRRIVETNSVGERTEEYIQIAAVPGSNLTLTIDKAASAALYGAIATIARERGFDGGGGVVLDVETGAVLALVSYPEYDSTILTQGWPVAAIADFISDARKPFFNRVLQGLYPSGSIIKPVIAIAALAEGVISPEKQIFSAGKISLPNPYDPNTFSVFYDWKAHGWVDMREAIAVSSNVYFYTIGGGFQEIAGVGIRRIKAYAERFGLGFPTGVDLVGEAEGEVPDPEWKAAHNSADPVWRVGDTYNVSIGQGGVQVTPLQMAVVVATLANEGVRVVPHVAALVRAPDGAEKVIAPGAERMLGVEQGMFRVVKEGMRRAVTHGTAQAMDGIGFSLAAKTGTAEIGAGKRVHSWVMGFVPYERPRLAFAIVLENGDAKNLVGAPAAARAFFTWMREHAPEYLQ